MIRAVAGPIRGRGLGLVDQGLSSLSNITLTVLVATAVSAEDFGYFSLAYTAYIIAVGVVDAVTSEPMIVRHSTGSRQARTSAASAAAGAALAVGLGLALVLCMLALASPPPLKSCLVALAVLLPVLLTQEVGRFAAFALDRPGAAVMSDAAWALGMVVTELAVRSAHAASPATLLLAWAVPGAVAAIPLLAVLRVRPRPGQAFPWLRANRDLAWPFAGEYIAGQGSQQLLVVLIGGIVNVATAGGLRAAMAILGPLNVLHSASRIAVIPELARIWARAPWQLRDRVRRLSLGLATATAVYGAAILLLPSHTGHQLFGDTWHEAAALLPWIVLSRIPMAATTACFAGLRATAAARASLVARTTSGGLAVVLVVLGAELLGAQGAAAGIAAGNVASAPIWWSQYRKVVGGRPAPEAATGEPDAAAAHGRPTQPGTLSGEPAMAAETESSAGGLPVGELLLRHNRKETDR